MNITTLLHRCAMTKPAIVEIHERKLALPVCYPCWLGEVLIGNPGDRCISDAYTCRLLEPGFLFDDVGLIEFLIGFRQVDDPFDEADDIEEAAAQDDSDDSPRDVNE